MLGCVAIHVLVISPRREIETYFYHRIKIVGATTLAGFGTENVKVQSINSSCITCHYKCSTKTGFPPTLRL